MHGRKLKLISHHITPMVLTKEGRVWLALCTIALSARNAPGHVIMRDANSKSYYEYSLDKHMWIKQDGITLSETERDVLTLSAQGYTMNDIANKLYKSVDTIKTCKRVLFVKMGVKNIVEALSYATNYKLL
jgi:DNA-binding NarL/FixJ family response regulator